MFIEKDLEVADTILEQNPTTVNAVSNELNFNPDILKEINKVI